MVAYDSRRTPDPSQQLGDATLDQLRAGLRTQLRSSGSEPSTELQRAIEHAAREARARGLHPEALLIQLKGLADEVGLPFPEPGRARRDTVREWMIGACLRAFWESDPPPA